MSIETKSVILHKTKGMKTSLNTVEEAIEDIKAGRVIIVVDDEDRENEGDFIAAARCVTPEMINFMATHGRGLICAPLIEDRCEELGLDLMVKSNNAAFETPFTVSVDLMGHGCTTGISASDRSKTIQALIDPKINPQELGKPGHIFPLKARKGGVLRRAGHTEAAIDISRLAGFEPAGVIVEIMNEDGSMARLPELMEIAKQFDLKIISIEDLIAYRIKNETLIERAVSLDIPTKFGEFKVVGYHQTTNNAEHLAFVKGEWKEDETVLVRVHSSFLAKDMFEALSSFKDSSINRSLEMIEKEGKGVLVYINQSKNEENLIQNLKFLKLQQESKRSMKDVLDKSMMDEKDYGIGAQILRDLNISKMKLISSRPTKKTGLVGYGLEIVENISMP